LLAGIMIFPAVFSFGLQPSSGAGLVFVTLPKIFSQLPFGNIISFAFFVLLFCAAVTSGISILEAPCATLIEKCKVSRIKACTILFILISLISIPAALSFGKLSDVSIIGKSIFDFLDFTTSNILLPLNSLILCLIMGWKLRLSGNTFFKNSLFVSTFNICLKFVVPIVLVGLLYIGLK
ncbi:sodium-dependent transporter, partial [bacterium]|nr:sodium-dependent transporter [bacterium]